MSHKQGIGFLFFPFTLLLLTSAYAQERLDERWYLTPGVSYIFADNNRSTEDDFGYQLGIGKPLNEYWNLELTIVGDKLDLSDGSSNFKQTGLGLDGLYLFNRDPSLAPYLVIGAGAMETKFAGNSNTQFMMNVGAGLLTNLTDDGLALRGDFRYRQDNDDSSVPTKSSFGDWIINLTLSIPLGAK